MNFTKCITTRKKTKGKALTEKYREAAVAPNSLEREASCGTTQLQAFNELRSVSGSYNKLNLKRTLKSVSHGDDLEVISC